MEAYYKKIRELIADILLKTYMDKNVYHFTIKGHFQYLFWKCNQYNNHDMALMLIEVLYEKQIINESTYKNIMKKNYYEYLKQ